MNNDRYSSVVFFFSTLRFDKNLVVVILLLRPDRL